jgi:MFS family permease
MADTTSEPAAATMRWYQGVPRYAWMVLLISALGWLFDAMDQNLFSLVRQPSLQELLKGTVPADQLDAAVKSMGGILTAVFLIGWAMGGFIFGMLGDRLGRTRTMMITILIYAAFTGLNGLVQDPVQYAVCRFLTALGVGGEFAAGAALVAEVWPERSRPMALGMLQALSAFGNMAAAVINLLSNANWRLVYFVGAAPALLVLWIRSSVKEPEKWTRAKEEQAKSGGGEIGAITALFREPQLKRNTIAGTLLALAGVGGVWGIGFFFPDLIGLVMKPILSAQGLAGNELKLALSSARSYVFLVQQVGAFLGMFSYAALSERTGRRPALALFFFLAFCSVQIAFWLSTSLVTAMVCAFILGFCALAPFSAYAVYFPELFPTRLRTTGVGFCYNCARILAAAAPFALGGLSGSLSKDPITGFRMAATVVSVIYIAGFVGLALAPETKGRPLPE